VDEGKKLEKRPSAHGDSRTRKQGSFKPKMRERKRVLLGENFDSSDSALREEKGLKGENSGMGEFENHTSEGLFD